MDGSRLRLRGVRLPATAGRPLDVRIGEVEVIGGVLPLLAPSGRRGSAGARATSGAGPRSAGGPPPAAGAAPRPRAGLPPTARPGAGAPPPPGGPRARRRTPLPPRGG